MKKFEVTAQKDTRSGFGAGLLEAAQSNENIVGLCADLTGSLMMDGFQKAFPHRFFQVGIAEANMMGLAAGLATAGKFLSLELLPTLAPEEFTIKSDKALLTAIKM